jgi:MFS family permease
MATAAMKTEISPRTLVAPLVLAQFVCSYAGSNMNVAINDIAKSLDTPVNSIQVTITVFTLTMAALMIPGSKLTDIWGRKFCFILGLAIYGIGAVIASFAHSIGVLMFGYSILEGVGTALLIPPVYILLTVCFDDLLTRAKYFGAVTGAAAIGSAAGPLIGGLITTGISWRASFIFQALIVAVIIVLGVRVTYPGLEGAKPRFDMGGAILSAAGLVCIVAGFLLAGNYGWFAATKDFVIGGTTVIPEGSISPVWIAELIGVLLLVWFWHHIGSLARKGEQPLVEPRLLRNRSSNLGLVTQNVQWLVLQGSFFVISVFLQTVREYSAIKTGVALMPATIGIILAALLAQRMAQRRTQRTLVRAGFLLTIAGLLLVMLLCTSTSNILTIVPGLLLIGLGVGMMLTASVNLVQSSFPEKDQGEISGVSRSVSNLGSSLGVSFVGSILVSTTLTAHHWPTYGTALLSMVIVAGLGLVAALFLPAANPSQSGAAAPVGTAAQPAPAH